MEGRIGTHADSVLPIARARDGPLGPLSWYDGRVVPYARGEAARVPASARPSRRVGRPAPSQAPGPLPASQWVAAP